MYEEKLIKIIKKSQENFLEHSMGLSIKKRDSLIITKKRILIKIRDKIINNIEYKDFAKINFNPMNDNLIFTDKEDKIQVLSLKVLRITYEEIQYLKNKLK